jgi:hypothetical protein
MASEPALDLSAAKVENTSGDPFEKARNVTPAWLMSEMEVSP